MSIVRVALPVTRGKRRFHLDKGKTWSVVEHLILCALADKGWTAQNLAEEAKLPRRVVVEAIIRLMEASWVELSQHSEGIIFRATEAGKAVAGQDELPTNPRRITRWMNFIADRVTGTVYRSRELPIFEKHVLEQRARIESFIWIEPREITVDNNIRAIVATLFEDDERFVAMETSGDRLVERFALITSRNGKIDGLPVRAPKELEEIVSEAIKKSSPTPSKPAIFTPTPIPQEIEPSSLKPRTVVFRSDDLILGADQHRELFEKILRDCRHQLIIHSTFITDERFDSVLPQLNAAIKRGVAVDILWGQDDDKTKNSSTRKAVNRIRQKILTSGLDDEFRVHPFSTGSHSKLIVSDLGHPRKHIAVVGSCNWLSSHIQSFEASALIRDPALVTDVLFQLAELSLGSDGHWTALTNYLTRLASIVQTEEAPQGARASAQLLLGPEHGAIMRQARDTATQRIFVTSHRLSQVGRPAVILPLIAAAEAKNIDAKIFFGIPSGENAGAKAADATIEAAFAGVSVRPVKEPRVHAKLLAWDNDYVVITSQNWLSADPSEGNKRREIGLFLHAAGAARRVIDVFDALRRS